MEDIIGRSKWEIDTPAFLVDLDKLERNIRRMADFFKGRPAGLRPHFKTPKTVEIALMQLRAGARGITCAKVSEAEVLVAGGVTDILIANEVVGRSKTARLAELNRWADVKCAVDDPVQVASLSEAAAEAGVTIGVVVDVYVGLPRCGVRPEDAAGLAARVAGAKGLRLDGVMGYEGHVVSLEDPALRRTEAEKSMAALVEAAESLRAAGLPCEIVSGGGTGTYNVSGVFPGVTEIQAGSYCLMDVKYAKIMPEFEMAATVLATVCSKAPALSGWTVTDAGIKSMTREFGLPELIGVPNTRTALLSEEHSQLETEGGESGLEVGDKVEFHPSHICTTINLYERMYVIRDERVKAVWPILGRGRSQ
jgi:D-serine deaminase-like pyridoxal phosphate-dependent protein